METIPIRHIKAAQNEGHNPENFGIRDVQALLGSGKMVQKLHRHDYYFILVLEKGEGSHEIDFSPYKICDHVVFFMRPGQVHQLTLETGSSGYLMEFKRDFYFQNDQVSNQLLRKASNWNFCQFDSPGFKKILFLVNCIFQEFIERNEGYQEVIRANLGIFFIELVRHRQGLNNAQNILKTYALERLEELLEHLETHVSSYKKVSQYAEMMNLSVYQLNAITKSVLGKTCSDLIDEYIILESKRYLLATSNQINQIAFYLGYEDVSYFIRFFKKHMGVTPESFRNNFR